MSRRKDRERFQAMQQLNPDYQGFRGYGADAQASAPPLEKVTCSSCGRARNVPVGVAMEHSDDYVCATCKEEAGAAAAESEGAGDDAEEPPAEAEGAGDDAEEPPAEAEGPGDGAEEPAAEAEGPGDEAEEPAAEAEGPGDDAEEPAA